MLNFASLRVQANKMPDDMFDHIFCELLPDDETYEPTLQTIFAANFASGLSFLPRFGPFSGAPSLVIPAALRAVSAMVEETPALLKLMQEEHRHDVLENWPRGKWSDMDTAGRGYLDERRNQLRMERNALEELPEPTFFDKQALEHTLRRLHLTCGLQELAFGLNCYRDEKHLNPGWNGKYITRGITFMMSGALCEQKPNHNFVFPPTTTEANEWNSRFAGHFLTFYGSTPAKQARH